MSLESLLIPNQFNVFANSFNSTYVLTTTLSGNGGNLNITPAAGAGSGATASIVGDNLAGQLTINTGTGVQADAVIVTIDMTENNPTFVVLMTPNNDNAFVPRYGTAQTADNRWTISTFGSNVFSDSTTYIFNYLIVGYST
jgi:hypothetical protein